VTRCRRAAGTLRAVARLLPALVLAALLAAAPSAEAGVVRAESVLPPGQSGFVAPTGVTSGTGSPHLNDQTALFVDFKRKPFLFNQPGEAEQPRADVKIVRDAYGVPAVTAPTDDALWWGAGYAVAQDRLFQLELFRRATTGRLAEILGEGYLDDDLIARRDYYTREERQRMLDAIPPRLRSRWANYRDGINAWIQHVRGNPQDMPGEFPALGVPLVDWSEDDSVAIGVFLARTVPSGSGVELSNLRTMRATAPAVLEQLVPLRTPGRRPSVPRRHGRFPSQPGRTRRQELRALKRSVEVSQAWDLPSAQASAASRANVAEGLIGRVGGSYMFAVRKPGGGALLFNGPQLGYSIPELFVELELHGPGVDVRGVTAAGVPLVAIGHNGRVAWGYTSGLSDEDDLYAEQVVGGAPAERYRFNGEERQMECRDEVFKYQSPPTDLLSFPEKVPSAGSKTVRVCRTVHGPVEVRAGGTAYARRYAIWGREIETLEGLTELTEANTIHDVDRALQKVTWNENIIAADSAGNIGYWHPGLHPLRPLGYDERLPYPGTGEAEWRGLLDRRRTPHVINPKQGWVANWNNVPSEGWTAGDSEASERNTGLWHRATWLMWLVGDLAKAPTWENAEKTIIASGTIAQQRPLFGPRLRKARRGARGRAADILEALIRWNGSYHTVDERGTVDPGVAIWEQYKDEVERIALERLGAPAATVKDVAGSPGSSHAFDISNGEAYGLRTLLVRGYREAAEATFAELSKRFKTEDIARWREPRKLYEVSAQGAAATPENFPFFDRGTWEQLIELSP